MGEIGDAVVGIVQRDRLSSALTTIHRGGHGHNARVLDGTRSAMTGQLRRAGVATYLDFSAQGSETVVILIHAPGRTAKAAELLHRAGATQVQVIAREVAVVPASFSAPTGSIGKESPVVTPVIATD
jgi:hypothetical protein